MKKTLYIIFGTIALIIGIIGIFIPGLPTTPFLLLTAALYVRSSGKLYDKLMSNPFIRSYIDNYRKNRGMSLRLKISSISLMWFMILISILFFIEYRLLEIVVAVVGVAGTVVMAFVVPTSGNHHQE